VSEGFLAERARTDADALALVEADGRRWRFGELEARARRRRAALDAAGVAPGDRVAVLLPTSRAWVELAHALDALGATLLPLHLRLTADEQAFQLRDAGARLLVHGDDALALRAAALARASGVASVRAAELDAPPAGGPTTVDPESPFALLYTSGTTGRPKGALLSRRAFRASARAVAALLGARPDDRWLACLPLYHVGGLSLVTRSALHGTALALHDGFDAARVSHALDAEGITGVSLVPTMLRRVLDARGDRPAPASLRVVLLGGAAAPDALLERAAAARFPVAPTYGATEACSQVATRPPGAAGGLVPLPGVEVRITGDDGRPAPRGAPGEIELRGPMLLSGYHGRADATAAALRGGWLRTGDVGALDARGRLAVLDRRADLIVSGGENVYPAEVERVLLEHPDVADAGVAGVPDPEFGARPTAWVVPRAGAAAAPLGRELERFCRERLAGYKVPRAFHAVETLPRNALGKLQRARLAAPPEPAEARG
jgi:O-succinylbenzoic acid--CoA ligase